MATLKTQKNDARVENFLSSVRDDKKREDCFAILEITREDPAMWGTSITGFGSYNYKYASGREGK